MKRRLPRIDRTRVRTVSARTRTSRVSKSDEARPHRPGASLRAFLAGLPGILAGADLRAVIDASARAARRDKLLLWGFGAHLIKVGLAPVLVDLMERGLVGGVLMNGAGCVHDLELAMMGRTSEDVSRSLDDGSFGMARETAEALNAAIAAGDARGLGMGEAIGRAILTGRYPHKRRSILATRRPARDPRHGPRRDRHRHPPHAPERRRRRARRHQLPRLRDARRGSWPRSRAACSSTSARR